MKTIKGDLILTEDTVFDDDLKVEGNIICKEGRWNLKCRNIDCYNINCFDIKCRNIDCYNINCCDINCFDINCYDIDCYNINCHDINCFDINCFDINCRDINCFDINCFAFVIAYQSFKCNSYNIRRENGFVKCLDKEIEFKVCSKCGRSWNNENKLEIGQEVN